MLRVVIDTNVFVSGIAFKLGKPKRIVDLWLRQKIILIASQPLIEELTEVLHREKFQKQTTDEEITQLIQQIQKIAVFVKGNLPVLGIIKDDPDDDVVLTTALEGNADYIVSGDHHLLDLGDFRGIKIVKPIEFLNVLDKVK